MASTRHRMPRFPAPWRRWRFCP